jgi:hypothetical protein
MKSRGHALERPAPRVFPHSRYCEDFNCQKRASCELRTTPRFSSKDQCYVPVQVSGLFKRVKRCRCRIRQVPVGQQSRDTMTRVAQSSSGPGHHRRYVDLFGCLSQIMSVSAAAVEEGIAAGYDHGVSLVDATPRPSKTGRSSRGALRGM